MTGYCACMEIQIFWWFKYEISPIFLHLHVQAISTAYARK